VARTGLFSVRDIIESAKTSFSSTRMDDVDRILNSTVTDTELLTSRCFSWLSFLKFGEVFSRCLLGFFLRLMSIGNWIKNRGHLQMCRIPPPPTLCFDSYNPPTVTLPNIIKISQVDKISHFCYGSSVFYCRRRASKIREYSL